MIGYKLFELKGGKLFPLYVLRKKETVMHKWLEAECGELKDGKVKSKLGPLCFRPGWHVSDLPYARHIGIKDSDGNIVAMHKNHVWCEVEYSDNVNYQDVANENGVRNGRLVPKFAYLTQIPSDGYYCYKTNPSMINDWIVAGAIKVNRILDWSEVDEICNANGLEALPEIK